MMTLLVIAIVITVAVALLATMGIIAIAQRKAAIASAKKMAEEAQKARPSIGVYNADREAAKVLTERFALWFQGLGLSKYDKTTRGQVAQIYMDCMSDLKEILRVHRNPELNKNLRQRVLFKIEMAKKVISTSLKGHKHKKKGPRGCLLVEEEYLPCIAGHKRLVDRAGGTKKVRQFQDTNLDLKHYDGKKESHYNVRVYKVQRKEERKAKRAWQNSFVYAEN